MMKPTLISILFLVSSCFPQSDEEIKQIKSPINFNKAIKIPKYGVINYQLYKKYGFTDVVEQIIEIQKRTKPIKLQHKLPLDSNIIKKLETIDIRKFHKNLNINYQPEKIINSDILLESTEYITDSYPNLSFKNGQYEIIKDENTEGIIIYDMNSELIYLEIKKSK